jgi:hypothetical protein
MLHSPPYLYLPQINSSSINVCACACITADLEFSEGIGPGRRSGIREGKATWEIV